jgi:hypothetical protein
VEGIESMKYAFFTLTNVEQNGPTGLTLTYADEQTFKVDLAPIIERHASLARLKNRKVFATAAIGDGGSTVVWGDDDDLELAADNLRARGIEQAGGVSHEFIWNWMHRNKLTLDQAADAIAVSRRMMAYYRSGEKTVPVTVGLACLGWERAKKAAKARGHDTYFALAA